MESTACHLRRTERYRITMATSSSSRVSLGNVLDSGFEFNEKSYFESNLNTSIETISRETIKEHLLCVFEENYDSLQDSWEKIGFSNTEKNVRCHKLMYHVARLFQEMVSEEKNHLSKLEDKIGISSEEIFKLSDELSLQPFEPDNTIVILDLEKVLRLKVDELTAEKTRRMDQLKELKEEEKELCERMSMPPLPLSVDEVPSLEDLRELNQHTKMLRAEKELRLEKFSNLKQQISTLVEELECSTTFQHEWENQVLLSEEKLSACKEFFQKLQAQKLENRRKVEDLVKRLSTLWQCLNKDEEERKLFLESNCDVKPSTLQRLKVEIARCTTIRKDNVRQYVENARHSLKELWGKCCLTEDQIAEITIINDDSYTELSLDLHEDELAKWNRYYDQNAEVFSNVHRLENLWSSFKEFEGRPKDPNRLENRGGALLQEEKERRKLEKSLVVVEKFLKEKADIYKKQEKNFAVWGKDLEEYVTNKRETYNSEKKRHHEEQKRKRSPCRGSRADTPDQRPNVKRRKFLGHLLVPGTSAAASASGCTTSRTAGKLPKHKTASKTFTRRKTPSPRMPPAAKSPTPSVLEVATYTDFQEGVPFSSTVAVFPEEKKVAPSNE